MWKVTEYIFYVWGFPFGYLIFSERVSKYLKRWLRGMENTFWKSMCDSSHGTTVTAMNLVCPLPLSNIELEVSFGHIAECLYQYV